jgi:hypothetical protein
MIAATVAKAAAITANDQLPGSIKLELRISSCRPIHATHRTFLNAEDSADLDRLMTELGCKQTTIGVLSWRLVIKTSGANKLRSGFAARSGPPCYAHFYYRHIC